MLWLWGFFIVLLMHQWALENRVRELQKIVWNQEIQLGILWDDYKEELEETSQESAE